MKITNIFKSIFSGAMKKNFSLGNLNGLMGLMPSRGSGINDTGNYIEEYKNWVYACVTARAEDVSDIKLKLMKGDTEVYDNPLLDLLNKVNDNMTKHDLINATQSYKDLDGNAFWFLARKEQANNMGEIVEIYILRPDRVKIITDKENPLQVHGYVYKQGAVEIPFEKTDIIHHKNFNPNGNYPFPTRGMGVVKAAYLAIYTDNQMREYNAAFFKNSARPDGMLIPDGDSAMSPDEFKRLKEEWNEEHRGSENASKIAILQGGLKWQEISRSQNDMQFIDQKRFNRDEILALFRVPKTLIGITEDVNRANADAAIYVFSLKTIKPLMQSFVDTLNEFLIPLYYGDKEKGVYRFEFKSPVPDDRAELRLDFQAGIFSRNEARTILGLPPTTNGDEFMGTMNEIKVDEVKVEKKPKAGTKPKKDATEEMVDKFIAKLPKAKKAMREMTALNKSNYIQVWKNHLEISEAPLKKKLVPYFEAQEEEVLKNLKREMKGLEAKEFKFKGVTDIIFDEEKAVKTGISLITPFIRDYIERSGKQGTTLADGTEFSMDTAKIKEFIPKRAEYFATTISETTTKNLLDTIQEGIDEGEDLESISQRVSDVYGIAKGSRTDMIARTEVAASSNFGATQAYLQAGVEQHQWVVVDPKDDDCLVNDGEIVKIGEAFNDGSTEAPIHPNCQCTTIPVFED